MDFFEDLKLVTKISAKGSLKGFKKNWYIIFLGFIYAMISTTVLTTASFIFRGPFSILAGLIASLLVSSLISNYLYLLELIIYGRKIGIDNFKTGFTVYLNKVYGVMFIFYIINRILGMVGGGYIIFISNLIIFIVFNALPETIYLKGYDSMGTIEYSLEFMKENWSHWLIHNILFGLAIYFMLRNLSFGGFGPIFTVGNIVSTLIKQTFIGLYMIYRGNLYKVLSSSTSRNRKYKYDRD